MCKVHKANSTGKSREVGGGRDRGLRGQGGGEEVIEGPRDCDRGLGLRK